jgi:hypothetical protein
VTTPSSERRCDNPHCRRLLDEVPHLRAHALHCAPACRTAAWRARKDAEAAEARVKLQQRRDRDRARREKAAAERAEHEQRLAARRTRDQARRERERVAAAERDRLLAELLAQSASVAS